MLFRPLKNTALLKDCGWPQNVFFVAILGEDMAMIRYRNIKITLSGIIQRELSPIIKSDLEIK
jgi:hypothetical protein